MTDKTKPEEQPPIIQARKADSEAKAWHAYQRETIQKTPERLEDAAKFLSGMISISLTVYLKLSPDLTKAAEDNYLNLAIMISWLLSLTLSFFVLFPFRYRYTQKSSKSIQETHARTIKIKLRFLLASVLLFLSALVLLSVQQVG